MRIVRQPQICDALQHLVPDAVGLLKHVGGPAPAVRAALERFNVTLTDLVPILVGHRYGGSDESDFHFKRTARIADLKRRHNGFIKCVALG